MIVENSEKVERKLKRGRLAIDLIEIIISLINLFSSEIGVVI